VWHSKQMTIAMHICYKGFDLMVMASTIINQHKTNLLAYFTTFHLIFSSDFSRTSEKMKVMNNELGSILHADLLFRSFTYLPSQNIWWRYTTNEEKKYLHSSSSFSVL
jgi:hypothetical protein